MTLAGEAIEQRPEMNQDGAQEIHKLFTTLGEFCKIPGFEQSSQVIDLSQSNAAETFLELTVAISDLTKSTQNDALRNFVYLPGDLMPTELPIIHTNDAYITTQYEEGFRTLIKPDSAPARLRIFACSESTYDKKGLSVSSVPTHIQGFEMRYPHKAADNKKFELFQRIGTSLSPDGSWKIFRTLGITRSPGSVQGAAYRTKERPTDNQLIENGEQIILNKILLSALRRHRS